MKKIIRLTILPIALILLVMMSSNSFALPIQWTSANGGNDHWYDVIVVPQGITWSNANSSAQAMGGGWHLGTVTSAAENNFIYNLFNGNPAFFSDSNYVHSNGPWIGGFATTFTSNDWQWVTGEMFSYTNWAPLEPYSNGNRLAYFGYHSNQPGPGWNDVPEIYSGLYPSGYIIETANLVSAPVPEPSTLILYVGGLAGIVIARWRFKGFTLK